MEAIAKAKYIKGSPRKARLVIDMIRGVNVAKALAILQFTNKRATDPISTCLKSAIANATFKAEQDNIAVDPDDLWVKTCFVDIGPTKGRRRMRPAPQGRAYKEQRHYCHITIAVSSEKPEVKLKEKPKKMVRETVTVETTPVKAATKAVKTEKKVAEVTETTETKE
jgi:large subunit ribosomal protein L22